MAFEPLPIETVALGELSLDLDNYRVPVRSEDENAALDHLYAQEDVHGTAKLILQNGYFDNELPIVVRDGEGFVVLEGNRRVSALKVLQDPDLIPDHESAVRALLKRYQTEAENLPTAIRVLVAPSAEVARPHIARVHTGNPKKPWTPDQQGKFYYSLLGPSTSVADVRAAFPAAGTRVVRLIKLAVMREFLSGIPFRDKSLHAYAIGDDLKMTSFEYAYKMADVAASIGVSFTKEGLLTPSNRTPHQIGAALTGAQLAAVEWLMSEFRAGRLNTRSPEFKKNDPSAARPTPHDRLMIRLLHGREVEPGDFPAPAPGGPDPDDPDLEDPNDDPVDDPDPVDPDDPVDDPDGAPDPRGGPPPAPRGPNDPGTKDRLDLAGLEYSAHAPMSLQLRYHELRRLSLKDNPVATAMLLRAVVESTIKFHFEGTATPATGELGPCMALVKVTYGSGRSPVKSAISRVHSADVKTPGSVHWFNDVCHSSDAVTTADTVRDAFKLVHPLLRLLLRPPSGAP